MHITLSLLICGDEVTCVLLLLLLLLLLFLLLLKSWCRWCVAGVRKYGAGDDV